MASRQMTPIPTGALGGLAARLHHRFSRSSRSRRWVSVSTGEYVTSSSGRRRGGMSGRPEALAGVGGGGVWSEYRLGRRYKAIYRPSPPTRRTRDEPPRQSGTSADACAFVGELSWQLEPASASG